MLIVEELRGEVNRRVDDADSVRPDRVGNVANVDRVQVFVVTALLHKYLVVHVVSVASDEYVNVSHDFQHVKSLMEKPENNINM